MRLALTRRDPWWEADGTAAKRRRRRRRAVATVAFVASIVAVVGAAAGWLLQIGLVSGVPGFQTLL